MSQPNNQDNNNPRVTSEQIALDATVIDRMRLIRDAMLLKFNEHGSGQHSLPPEQSIELRSHIQYISRTIEPGKHELWPDYSPAEKGYIAEQAKKRHEGAIDVELAALGPWGGLAGLAKSQGAPLETVENLMKHGVDMMAVAGLAHAKSRNDGVIEPAELFRKGEARMPEQSLQPKANTNAMMQQIKQDVTEMQPILEWFKTGKNNPLNKYDEGRLAVLLEHYGGKDAKSIAELGSHESIDQHTLRYREEGMHLEAINNAHRVTHDFIDAITRNGEIEPAKLKQTLQDLRDGDFMTAKDFAALEYMREVSHQHYITDAAREAQLMARVAGESDQQSLTTLATRALLNAHEHSPYRHFSEQDQSQQHNQGPER